MAQPETGTEEREEAGYALDDRRVAGVRSAVAGGEAAPLQSLLAPLHAADLADLLEQVDEETRRGILTLGGDRIDGEVLSDLDESIREEVFAELSHEALTAAVRDLESDDAVDLMEDLAAPRRTAILEALGAPERLAIEQALSYPEHSAGRLMQREVVRAPAHWAVGDAIDFLRAGTAELPEQFYHLVLVDPRMRPVGNVTLGRLLASKRHLKLADIAEAGLRTIPVTQPEAEVAYAFNQYHLLSAPVVDEEGRLVGVITIDDAMIVLDREAEEDLLRLAGVGEESLSSNIRATARARFPWLLINLATAILASVVISQFEDTIARIVALAVLMPVVASMGGNAGTQSLTVAVRALATKDITGSNTLRVIRREAVVGALNGLAFALVMGVVTVIWFGSPVLGVVMGMAMVLTLIAAAAGGILIPILLDRMGVDPALAAGPFVTTVTDVVGFFAFLGLATLIIA